MTESERLRAVIRENNALRKANDGLRETAKEIASARREVVEAGRRESNAYAHVAHYKGRDEARAKVRRTELDMEWNAAIEAALAFAEGAHDIAVSHTNSAEAGTEEERMAHAVEGNALATVLAIRTLKRKVAP